MTFRFLFVLLSCYGLGETTAIASDNLDCADLLHPGTIEYRSGHSAAGIKPPNPGAIFLSLSAACEPATISWRQRGEELVRFPTAVVLTIVNNANVPADVLEAAKSEVDRIYGDAGIRVLWERHKEEKDWIVDLTIVIVPDCVNEKTCSDKISTGIALGDEGLGARRAYILFNRIREVACKLLEMLTSRGEALILGLTMAHEAGHLLLSPGHAPEGLMRSRMDISDVSTEAHDDLLFTTQQSFHMRDVLIKRTLFGKILEQHRQVKLL